MKTIILTFNMCASISSEEKYHLYYSEMNGRDVVLKQPFEMLRSDVFGGRHVVSALVCGPDGFPCSLHGFH